jgi:hypothetical protein
MASTQQLLCAADDLIRKGGKIMQVQGNETRSTKEKKPYSTPQLITHGDVEVITQAGGSSFVDVPLGTPVGDVTT